MRKSTILTSIIPILFIIEFIGARLLDASDAVKTICFIFIMGLAFGNIIGVQGLKATLEEGVIASKNELKYFNVLRAILLILGGYLIIEICCR